MKNTNHESNIVKSEKNRSLTVRSLINAGFLMLYFLAFGFFALLFIHNEQMGGIIKVAIGVAFMVPLSGLILGEGAKLAKSEFSRINRGDTVKILPKKVPFYVPLLSVLPAVLIVLFSCALGVCLGQKFIFFQTVAIHLASPISLVFLGFGIVKVSVVSPLSLIPIVIFVITVLVLFLSSFYKEQEKLVESHRKIANEIKFNSRFNNK